MDTLESINKYKLNVLWDYGDYPVVITHNKTKGYLSRAKTVKEAVALAVCKLNSIASTRGNLI